MLPTNSYTQEEIEFIKELISRCGSKVSEFYEISALKKNYLFFCINQQEKNFTPEGIQVAQEVVNKTNYNHTGSI